MQDTPLALLALATGVVIGGVIAALIAVAISARRRAFEQASLDVPPGISDVLAAMDDAAVVVDGGGTVRAASLAAAAFGMRVDDHLVDETLRRLARSAREAGASAASTLTIRRAAPPAEERLVSARATQVSPRLVLMVIRDITERERVEQMRRDFVANTSHELKTPVGAVTLLAEAIESAAEDPDQVRNFAGRLSAEAARLASLTSRVMNLSRLQSADELSERRDSSVDSIITSAIEANATSADAAKVTLVRGGERGIYVHGDSQVLAEAVSNLISNAIAYSPAGSSVGIGVKRVEGTVEIAVADRVIGMSPEDQERIFERFFRSDQARSRRTGGSGLGLAIVKHAVQRHGGEVRVWSRLGRGSTFTIQLPAVAPPADAPLDRGAGIAGVRTPARPEPVAAWTPPSNGKKK